MSIVRLADCPAMPWKNGRGRTRELAVHPSGAGMDDFLWRVSLAEVDSAAPFSAFPGIDRVIALLAGDGFTMTLDDGRSHALTTPCAPFAFPGEAGVDVTLAGGPSHDFNLMLRRGRARGGIEAWHGAGTRQADAGIVLVYCVRGCLDCADGSLQAGDAWRPPAATGGAIILHADALALAVRVEILA
ncbi:HutD family protein [Rhodanobacter sp. DHB23]|uniref:HutD/Ves family protein n=1 Tax=Rhodanobacter sp. DHB23 TaxID=2775923 RepID=UPI0017852C00|nr:HutD family protein [Rhodanobacter sp. DHB23]MBD8874138.1 HutD family protein [Rhodanobacter sp. DHB23]